MSIMASPQINPHYSPLLYFSNFLFFLSIYLSIYVSIYPSIYLCIYLSICFYIYIIFMYLLICLLVYLSIYESIYLSIYLYVHLLMLILNLHLHLHLSRTIDFPLFLLFFILLILFLIVYPAFSIVLSYPPCPLPINNLSNSSLYLFLSSNKPVTHSSFHGISNLFYEFFSSNKTYLFTSAIYYFFVNSKRYVIALCYKSIFIFKNGNRRRMFSCIVS